MFGIRKLTVEIDVKADGTKQMFVSLPFKHMFSLILRRALALGDGRIIMLGMDSRGKSSRVSLL